MPQRGKKMKKKTIYSIIMFAVIAAIAAAAILLVGRHQGWFDKPAPADDTAAITVTVRKGLSNFTRSGIASELSGETTLRQGDVVSVTSGYVSTRVGGCHLLLSPGSKLEITSAEPTDLQVRLVTGEAFCQASDANVTLLYGAHAAKLQSAVFVCTVRTGSETVYVLGGSVSDGVNTFSTGKAGSYVGQELSVQALDLRALSSFALECVLGCEEEMYCTADEVKAVLTSRKVVPEVIKPTEEKPDSTSPSGGKDPSNGSGSDTPANSDTATDPNPPSNSNDPSKPDSKPSKPDDSTKPTGTKMSCTIEIRCDTILNNMKDLEKGLDEFVPSDGTILPTTTVTFTQGESVFDVLKRICDEYGIQIEYTWTTKYGSTYIEGINYLYEFSCGQQSGWMYKVNGWFPNYGCSKYILDDGDEIVWCYTCKGLGTDVGAPDFMG